MAVCGLSPQRGPAAGIESLLPLPTSDEKISAFRFLTEEANSPLA